MVALAVAWFALGLVLACEDTVLEQKLWVMLGGVHLLHSVAGAILFLVMGFKAGWKSGWRSLPPWLVPVLGIVLWFAFDPVSALADHHRFLAAKPRYDSIVSAVSRANFPAVRQSGGLRLEVDPNLHMVAFPQSGFLGDWTGIVWDPSHRVAGPDRGVRRAFGSDLNRCDHLVGDYFRCGFS